MSSAFQRKDIEFNAEGTLLRGWLYQPAEVTNPLPAIVMTPGYNCIKEFYLDKYADVFARLACVVLVFDNRNMGDSDGEPRQEIDPWQQVKDYRHAISFLQTQSFVDPHKIGIWGSSYSGGHVLVVAAIDKRVKCVVAQVPVISGWENTKRRLEPNERDKRRAEFDQDRINRFKGQAPKMIPMVTDPKHKGVASHPNEDSWNFFTGKDSPPDDQWRFKKWRNETTLRSLEMYSEYEPGIYIERIAPTPLLMQVADQDIYAVTEFDLQAFERAGEIKKLHLFSGGHLSAYTDKIDELAASAAEWFKKYLL